MNRAFILNKRLIAVIMRIDDKTALFQAANSTDDAPVVASCVSASDYG
jgi:hypothetical protein